MTFRLVRYSLLLAILVLIITGCHAPRSGCYDRLVIGEVMMKCELPENLRELCMEGGRLSGSENGHRAERFVAGRLRHYGLANVHFEPFPMATWQDRETVVTVLDDPPHVLEGSLSLGNCLSTPPEGVTATLVDVGRGTEEEFEAAADTLAGSFALTHEGGPHRGTKMRTALEHGAAGMIQISRLEDQARVGQCHRAPRPEPGVVVIGKHGKVLTERLANGEEIRVNVKVDAKVWDAEPNNVIGEIPGRGPLAHEIVIVCAHLDSWHLAEGAIDNGNGSAAILETARALAQIEWQPKRTVRFIWFMGEEHGLHGSTAYVAAHKSELDDIVAVLNVDMPGSPRKLATFGHPEIVPFLQQLAEELPGYLLNDGISNATWTASDHAPFMKQGVCAIGTWGELGPGVKYYHSFGDMYEVVDLRATIQSSAVMAVLVRRLADLPTRPTERFDPVELKEKMGW